MFAQVCKLSFCVVALMCQCVTPPPRECVICESVEEECLSSVTLCFRLTRAFPVREREINTRVNVIDIFYHNRIENGKWH